MSTLSRGYPIRFVYDDVLPNSMSLSLTDSNSLDVKIASLRKCGRGSAVGKAHRLCEQNRNAAIVFCFHATVTDRDKDKERERETEKERAERGKREREGGKKQEMQLNTNS